MAAIHSEKKKALLRFQQSLEDLTFNSKPLIDDLTRAADNYKMFAAEIIETIESRIMQVRVDWKLPSLYLLDSILKNLSTNYKEEISRIIVGVFCHCFEKLVEPDARKSLHKLRLTWPPYIPTRKLAAIDRHVHALDPNWPVIAMDNPPSPNIFVNPIFLKPSDSGSKGQSTRKSASPVKNLEEKSRQAHKKRRSKSPAVPPNSKTPAVPPRPNSKTPAVSPNSKTPAVPPNNKTPAVSTRKSPAVSTRKSPVGKRKKEMSPPPHVHSGKLDESSNSLSIQERRSKILEDKRKQRMEQQRVLGLGPSASKNTLTGGSKEESSTSVHVSKVQSGAKTKASTPPISRSISPSNSRTSRKGRSVSPLPPASKHSRNKRSPPSAKTAVNHNHTGGGEVSPVRHKQSAHNDSAPPTEKRPRLEVDADNAEMTEIENSETRSSNASRNVLPIKKTHLELDDLPPQLLSTHHDLILKQMENHLESGGLSSEQHQIIVNQIDELYKLQELKKEADSTSTTTTRSSTTTTRRSPPPRQQEERRETPSPKNEPPSSNSQDTRKSSSNLSTQTLPPISNDFGMTSESISSRGRHHPYSFTGPAPPSNFDHPTHDEPRYHPSQRGYRERRGFRPWRGPPPRRGEPRRWYPDDVPPAGLFPRPPRRVIPGPPPPRLPGPQWHEPMDIDQGPIYQPRPPPVSSGGPSGLPVSELFSKLVATGIIGDPPPPGPQSQRQHPVDTAPGGGQEQIESIPLNIPNLSLTPATLRQRYGALISLLNAGEPCTSCGLRFTNRSSEVYRKHLDWHFKMNRKESEGLARSSRNWFIHPEDWLTFEELSADNENKDTTLKPLVTKQESREESEQPTEEEVVSCEVLPGEGNEVCWICQEPFEQFWEEEEEEWHFKDALRKDSKLYHSFCYKDAKETGSLESSMSQLPSPVEVKQEPFVD